MRTSSTYLAVMWEIGRKRSSPVNCFNGWKNDRTRLWLSDRSVETPNHTAVVICARPVTNSGRAEHEAALQAIRDGFRLVAAEPPGAVVGVWLCLHHGS